MKNDKEKIGSFKKSVFGIFPNAIFSKSQRSGFSRKPSFQKVSVRGFPESQY